jgi:hypothetical protein
MLVTPKVVIPETRRLSTLMDERRETIPEFTVRFVLSKEAIPLVEFVAKT